MINHNVGYSIEGTNVFVAIVSVNILKQFGMLIAFSLSHYPVTV